MYASILFLPPFPSDPCSTMPVVEVARRSFILEVGVATFMYVLGRLTTISTICMHVTCWLGHGS